MDSAILYSSLFALALCSGTTVIRETRIYRPTAIPSASPLVQQVSDTLASSNVENDSAGLLTTLLKLRPLLHHPFKLIKFLLNYALLGIGKLLYLLYSLIYSIMNFLLRSVVIPVLYFPLRPFIALYFSSIARFIFAGLLVGACLGLIAGYTSSAATDFTAKFFEGIKKVKIIGASSVKGESGSEVEEKFKERSSLQSLFETKEEDVIKPKPTYFERGASMLKARGFDIMKEREINFSSAVKEKGKLKERKFGKENSVNRF